MSQAANTTDRLTGDSVTFDGVGPALNQSVYMNFDFSDAQGNLYTIAVGDTITDSVPGPGAGQIETPGGVDIYTFSATAGQQVFFDLFGYTFNASAGDSVLFDLIGVAPALASVHWELEAPDGAVVFNHILNCCGGADPGVITLDQTGVYTITVGDDQVSNTGVYGFSIVLAAGQ